MVQLFRINFLGGILTVGGTAAVPKSQSLVGPTDKSHWHRSSGTIHTVSGTQRHSSPILPSVSERHIAVLRLTCISKCMKKLRRQPVRAEFASTESFSRTVSSAKAPCCARTCGTKTDAPYANVSTMAATYWLIW